MFKKTIGISDFLMGEVPEMEILQEPLPYCHQ
jgi:hypothetical protein